MIGKKIIFKESQYRPDTNSGEVLDKIVESDSERGYVHRVNPKMIVRVVV